MARKLFPDGDYYFEESGGAEYENGKVYHPALLHVTVTKARAWRLLREIMHDLEHLEGDVAGFTLVGAINRQDEGGNKIAMDGSESQEANGG